MQQDENALLKSMYDAYQAVLRIIAKNRGIPVDDISDIIQETFISYYKNYPLDWNESQKKAMLVQILKRKCIDYYRRNSHYSTVSIDGSENFDEMEFLMNRFVNDSLDSIISDETYAEIRKCILSMKRDWRNVSVLYFVEGYSIKEICEILGISGTVCRSRISRARKHLKSVLGPIFRP